MRTTKSLTNNQWPGFKANTLDFKRLVVAEPCQKQCSGKIDHIAISGGTGYLAQYIIRYLVKCDEVKKITVFARSKQRAIESLKQAHPQTSLEKLRWVEDDENWADALEGVDHLIHGAAHVSNVATAKDLWESNVVLTERFLKAWEKNKEGTFHLISTLSVFASSNCKETQEEKKIGNDYDIFGGYAQTKWAAEYLLSKYENARVWRLGLLTPSIHEVYFKKNDFFFGFLSCLKELGAAPEMASQLTEVLVDLSPVDEVANFIVNNLLTEKRCFHLANASPVSLGQIVLEMEKRKMLKFTTLDSFEDLLANQKRPKIEERLVKNAIWREGLFGSKYMNIDVFQTTGFNWTEKEIFTPGLVLLNKYLDCS